MGCSGHLQALRKIASTTKNIGLFFSVLCAVAMVAWVMIVKGDNKVAELKEVEN